MTSVGTDIRRSVQGDLARERQGIFDAIRGDNVGPVSIPRFTSPNLTSVDLLLRQADNSKDPAERQMLLNYAALERKYAQGMAGAQDAVQAEAQKSALPLGPLTADQVLAQMQRKEMAQAAAQRYNSALPFGLGSLVKKKDEMLWGLGG